MVDESAYLPRIADELLELKRDMVRISRNDILPVPECCGLFFGVADPVRM